MNDIRANRLFALFNNGNLINLSFSTLVADNLVSNWIEGFQSNFNNGYFCLRCFKRNLPISASTFDTRTIINHDNIVQQIPYKSPLTSVAGPSPILNLVGFHPAISLSADPMHDFVEAVRLLVVMGLLKKVLS